MHLPAAMLQKHGCNKDAILGFTVHLSYLACDEDGVYFSRGLVIKCVD
jgi:hypothetical protein